MRIPAAWHSERHSHLRADTDRARSKGTALDEFALTVRFTIKGGHEQEFDRLTADTLDGIHAHEPGTLVYVTHKVVDAPNQRIFYELYRDRAAFDAHEQQPHVRRFLAERDQHLDSAEVDWLTPAAGKTSATTERSR